MCCVEIILYHLDLILFGCFSHMDVWTWIGRRHDVWICVWICLDILVSSCKNIFIPIVLSTCGLEIFVMCATGCIYHVFKCIRDICDSVKFFL